LRIVGIFLWSVVVGSKVGVDLLPDLFGFVARWHFDDMLEVGVYRSLEAVNEFRIATNRAVVVVATAFFGN